MTLKWCIRQLLLQWGHITNIPKWGGLRQQLFILDDASADPVVGSWSRAASAGLGSRVHLCVSHPFWISRLRRIYSQDGGRRARGWAERDEFSYSLGLVLAHLSVSSHSVGQSKSHVQDQIQEMTKQICRLNERNYKVTGQRPRYKEWRTEAIHVINHSQL